MTLKQLKEILRMKFHLLDFTFTFGSLQKRKIRDVYSDSHIQCQNVCCWDTKHWCRNYTPSWVMGNIPSHLSML